MVLMAVTISAFYNENEPADWLWLVSPARGSFLWKKTGQVLAFSALLLVPPLVAGIIFHPELWLVSCYVLLACLLVVVFSMVSKYSLYVPAQAAPGKSTHTAIFLLFFLVPFLAPVNLVWLVRNVLRARTNLALYLALTSPKTH